jgi:membrane protein implicated in regulation of membrane protease activity
MFAMTFRVSPVSRTAALLIIAVGVFVLFTGLVADVIASDVAGFAFIVLGVFLYWFLYRITPRLDGKAKAAPKSNSVTAGRRTFV